MIKPLPLRVTVGQEDGSDGPEVISDQVQIIHNGIKYFIYPGHHGLKIQSSDTELLGRMSLSVRPHSGNVIYLNGIY